MSGHIHVPYDLYHRLVCEEHNEHSAIVCCPYPGCKNGTDTDSIVTSFPHSKEKIFRRAAWRDADGEVSYSWEGDLPLWFSLNRIFWREAVRKKIIPQFERPAPTLYQYTSLSGFLGLVQSGELWLTDYAYLNDALEVRYGMDLARERFEVAAQQRPDAATVLKSWGESTVDRHRVCVACFSRDGDSLSQWREYGPIAVGFEPAPLAFGYSNTSTMNLVVYERRAQERLFDLMAHLTASAWEHDRASEPDKVGDLYRDGTDHVLGVAAIFKDPRFVDEREIRLVHAANIRAMSAMSISQPPYRFRTTEKLIVPYLTSRDVASSHPDKLPIREVVVGPGSTAAALSKGVGEVLRENGYADVSVRLSTTPLRR